MEVGGGKAVEAGFCRVDLRLAPRDLAFVQAILEGYEGLATPGGPVTTTSGDIRSYYLEVPRWQLTSLGMVLDEIHRVVPLEWFGAEPVAEEARLPR